MGAPAGSPGSRPWLAAGTKRPDTRVMAGRGRAERPERGRVGASRGCHSAVKPKAGLLSGSATVAMTRPAWRGGIGRAGTCQRASCWGGWSGRGRRGSEKSPAPMEVWTNMGGTPSVGGPVPLAWGGCAGARWLERMLINQGGSEHPNLTLTLTATGLSVSPVTPRVMQ